MTLSFSLIILFIFGVMGYLSFRIYLDLFEEEISKQFSKANEQALARLELRILDVYRVSNYVVFHPYVEYIVKNFSAAGDRSSYDKYLDRNELSELLSQVKLDAPQLISFYLFDLEGQNYYFENGLMTINNLSGETFWELYDDLQNTTGDLIWSSKSLPSSIEKSGYRNVLVASRWMKTTSQEKYGILVMVFDQSLVSRELKELTHDDSGKVYLYDQRNKLLYTDDDDRNPDLPYITINKTGVQKIDGTPYIFVKNRSEQISFSLVSRVSLKDIQKKSKIIFNITLYLGVLSILFTAALVAYNSRSLLGPLKILVQGMRKLREGNFAVQIPITTRDELAFIGQNFNSMAEHINSLIKEVYLRKLSEREAELKALQAQLNPHFLYNALDMIYWKVYLYDRDTAQIVVSLAEMLRYVLEPVNKMVTLKDELHQIRNYLHIQKARFEDDLQTLIEVDDDVLDCRMIRFLLQPLAENIFVHAFLDKASDKRILIKANRNEDKLHIRIADNGCGMDPDTISYVLGDKSYDGSEKRQGLGLQSVIRRIDLMYGPDYGIGIESPSNEGTIITILLPYQTSNIVLQGREL
jgi:two-component system sensor histidine kinase YesM